MLSILLSTLVQADVSPDPILVEGALCRPNTVLARVTGPKGERSIVAAGYEILKRIPEIGYVTVRVPMNAVAQAKLNLTGKPGIAHVELDYAKQLAYTPNDPLWPNQWHMRTIKADLAWDRSFGIPIIVAVIDTGVRVDHPDLAANMWVNDHEIPANGIDDDANGYVDDINGYDFANLDSVPDDIQGHGTACAGLVGAVQDNGVGVTGVAPNARIMALKATNASGFLYDSYLVPSYIYAANMGARVLSMSYFSDRVSDAERQALDYCWRKGILPVAAAGNDNTLYPYYPAAYENVLSVAATTGPNDRASFSDYGSWVDVAAPGVSLTTTAVGGYTGGFGGTSGACPHVAGLATLLFGSRSNLTNAQVRYAIEDTGIPVTEAGIGEYCNYGLVDCQAALNSVLSGVQPIRDAVVRYITPSDAETSSGGKRPPTRIYGRGFQLPHQVSVRLNNVPLQIVSQTRDYVDVNMPVAAGTLVVTVDGLFKGATTIASAARVEYAAAEIGTKGASMQEGTYSKLYRNDKNVAICTRRSDGRIYVQGTFRLVRATPAAAVNGTNLVIRRQYKGTVGGTEKIYLYDWSSASFPYGNFVELSSMPVPTTATTTTINLANLPRFIDFEGTVYLYIDASGTDPDATLELDQAILSKPR